MRGNVDIKGDALVSLYNLKRGFDKGLEKALRIEGYRLKQEMAQAIKEDQMGWSKPSPLTLEMRKRYKRKRVAGIYFARFVRYAVGERNGQKALRVGVLNPKYALFGEKVKPLSKSLIANAERFAKGWSYTISKEDIRKRIKAYLKAKNIRWEDLTPRQKKRLKQKMKKLGIIKKPGSISKAPPRPVESFLKDRKKEIYRNLHYLYKKALSGEKIPDRWWEKMK